MSNQLTPVGLVVDSATEIKDRFDASFKAVYGDSVGSEPDGSIPAASAMGQEIALLVDSEASAGEMMLALAAAYDPDQAEDAAQDVICALTGTRRKPALYSTVLEACAGTIGTPLKAGRVCTVQGLGTRFDSVADATLAAVAANWAAATPYLVNATVNANGKIWQCIGSGTSANPAPAGSGQQADGGGVLWYAVGVAGQGVALVKFRAEQTGPLSATQGQLSQIATPVDGWKTAVNAAGTDSPINGLGANVETSAALRVRREQELQSQGGGPADAIRAALEAIPNVLSVTVFVNSGDAVDGNGLPPHSIDVMILAPAIDDQTLANAVWKAVGGGTATSNAVGTPISKTVKDASGNSQTVRYSRPTAVPIFIQATVFYDPLAWQVPNVNAAIIAAAKSAVGTFAAGYYLPGFQVRVIPLASSVVDGPQATQTDSLGNITPIIPAPAGSAPAPGFVDVTMLIKRSGGVFGPGPVAIAAGEIATFDPANETWTPSSEAP